jgi:mannitol/fructose-specific phosphotransferase system IIA component (Ntr-type)
MVDSNAREVRQAQLENIVAFNEDAMHINNKAHTEFYGCGNLVALTTNPDLNRMLCHRWADLLDDGKTYRWEKEGYETEQHKHLLVGERIWSSHPPQRLLSHNGDDGAPIRVIHRGRGPLPDPAHILLTARGDTVSPQSPKKISPEDTSWLVYDPEQDKQALALPLAPQDILFSNSQTIRHLYREMLQHIQQKHPDIDPEKLLLEMREREEAYAGLMSNGIALPHTWSDAVDEALLVVARVRDGCPSDDQAHTIQLAFMLLSPSGDPQKHLHHVSLVARLIGTEAKRQALFAAESPAELFEVIAEG